MKNEQSRPATKEERNFIQWCAKLENKNESAMNNDIALHAVATFKPFCSEDVMARLYSAIAVMEAEPESAKKSLYMASLLDFKRELEENGFIEKDVMENMGAKYDGNGEIDYNFDLIYKAPTLVHNQSNKVTEPSKGQIDHSSVTERECEQIAFNDYCVMVAENPMTMIDDIEALNTIADFENPDDDEQSFRLSAAIRLLRLQTPTPTNRVIMAALKDSKEKTGCFSKIDGVEVGYDY